jgi:hypothetical protein
MPDATAVEAIVAPNRNVGAIRWHELALQKWLHNHFLHAEGFPYPVLFSSPQDAYATFKLLWGKGDKNPFNYLLELKDAEGNQVFRPYPEPPKYPMMTVSRKGYPYRASQNYSTKRWRRIAWPTVSDDVTKSDLGNVVTSRMPQAFNFKFQVDFFCLQPETLDLFVTDLMTAFWRSGGQLQTWIRVEYPGHFYKKSVRMFMDGDIDIVNPPEPEEGKIVEHRASFSVVIEGYNVDIDYQILPTLWHSVLRGVMPAGPDELTILFENREDLRPDGNPSLDQRENVPPKE